MKSKINFETVNQKQFEYILNLLIMYKGLFPHEEVYLNESSIIKSMNIINKTKKEN